MKEYKCKKKQPLSDTICEALRRDILSGKLKPGQRLMEIHYAEQLGVSRTPLREAMRKLELEGLVTIVPRRGAHVTVISRKDVEDVLEVRTVLDGLAAALALPHLTDADMEALKELLHQFEKSVTAHDLEAQIKTDEAFHEYIYMKSENERLIGINHSIKDHIYRCRVLYLKDISDTAQVDQEHRALLQAFVEKDVQKVRTLSEEHVKNQKITMLNHLDIC